MPEHARGRPYIRPAHDQVRSGSVSRVVQAARRDFRRFRKPYESLRRRHRRDASAERGCEDGAFIHVFDAGAKLVLRLRGALPTQRIEGEPRQAPGAAEPSGEVNLRLVILGFGCGAS